MAYMVANDALDTLFVQLQTRLNSSDTAPCENMVPDHPARLVDGHGQPDTCLSHDWGNDRGRPRFYYAPEAAALVNAKFCPACKASWYVAVARNLMFGIVS